MEKFLEKIDEYNIFNYLLPGVIFTYLLKYYIGIDIFQENIVEMIFIYYFIGSIISRVGSIILESILIKIKFIYYTPNADYIKSSKKDKKINRLLTVNNVYRSFCAGSILLLILKIVKELILKYNIPQYIISTILIMMIALLYLFSYRKQTKYIVQRIKKK